MKEFHFTPKDIEMISKVLEVKPIKRVDNYRFVLENKRENRKLSLEKN